MNSLCIFNCFNIHKVLSRRLGAEIAKQEKKSSWGESLPGGPSHPTLRVNKSQERKKMSTQSLSCGSASWHVSFTLKALLIANIRIIIIIITTGALLIFHVSKYFLIICLGTCRPGGRASANRAVLWPAAPPSLLFSRQSLTISQNRENRKCQLLQVFLDIRNAVYWRQRMLRGDNIL